MALNLAFNGTRTRSQGIKDIKAMPTPIENIWLSMTGGAPGTANGYGVDEYGNRCTNSFSLVIGAAGTPTNLVQQATAQSVAMPIGMVGMILKLSGPVYFDYWNGLTDADFAANYANYPSLINDPQYDTFGRVSA